MEQYCLLAFNTASQAQLISSFLFLIFTLIGVLTLSIHATAISIQHKTLLILSYLCTLALSVISNTKTMKSVYSKSSSQTYLLFSFGIVSLIVQQCNKLLFYCDSCVFQLVGIDISLCTSNFICILLFISTKLGKDAYWHKVTFSVTNTAEI